MIQCSFLCINLGSQCRGFCGQGEGDCDNDGECLDGLFCEFDGWWGDDFCRAGRMNTEIEFNLNTFITMNLWRIDDQYPNSTKNNF